MSDDGVATFATAAESLALLEAFREIRAPELRRTLLWLAQTLAGDLDDRHELLGLCGLPPPPRRRLRPDAL